MRVLLVHRYYWPDVPTYAQIIKFMGQQFAQSNHDVAVLCGPATYNNAYKGPPLPSATVVDGIQVRRVRLPPDDKTRPAIRVLSMLWFAARLVSHAARRPRRYDLITVTTIPPIMMGLAARLVKKLSGTPFVYHCMDLYPEVAQVAGFMRVGRLFSVARWLDDGNCRNAAAVVVLSEDMRTTLAERGLDVSNVEVINNFEIEDDSPAVAGSVIDSPLPKPAGAYRVLFAGNMGYFQALDTLVDAVEVVAYRHSELEVVFMGSGARTQELKDRAQNLRNTIKFLDHQPLSLALKVMQEADLAVVSLAPDVYRVAYPSKTVMYLKAGCRLLVIVDPESELAEFVQRERLGTTCAPGNLDDLVKALDSELAKGPGSLEDREHAREVCERFFGRQKILLRWEKLVAGVGKEMPR